MARQDDYTRYTLRIPASVYQRIQGAARAQHKSVNAEIVARLEAPEGPVMSMRDWLAGQALAALIARGDRDTDLVSRDAYDYADAMLAERSK